MRSSYGSGRPIPEDEARTVFADTGIVPDADYLEFVGRWGGCFAGIAVHAWDQSPLLGTTTCLELTASARKPTEISSTGSCSPTTDEVSVVGVAPGAAASPCAGYGRGGRSSRAGRRPTLEAAITPALGALLYVTFLAVPFRALLVGVLRVVLTPYVDCVIVFTRLAAEHPIAFSLCSRSVSLRFSGLAAVVVVMQTLVELLGMVVHVRVIPRLVRSASTPRASSLEATLDGVFLCLKTPSRKTASPCSLTVPLSRCASMAS